VIFSKKCGKAPKVYALLTDFKVCDGYFGEARQSGSSHKVYKTPWQGDPRVNVQNAKGRAKGKAKAYQVKQVLQAIELVNLLRIFTSPLRGGFIGLIHRSLLRQCFWSSH
jgi:hypothetical protein